jgi:hypothetical protein
MITLTQNTDPYTWPNLREATREWINNGHCLRVTARAEHHWQLDEYVFEVAYYINGMFSTFYAFERRDYTIAKLREYVKEDTILASAIAFIRDLPEPWTHWTDGTDV